MVSHSEHAKSLPGPSAIQEDEGPWSPMRGRKKRIRESFGSTKLRKSLWLRVSFGNEKTKFPIRYHFDIFIDKRCLFASYWCVLKNEIIHFKYLKIWNWFTRILQNKQQNKILLRINFICKVKKKTKKQIHMYSASNIHLLKCLFKDVFKGRRREGVSCISRFLDGINYIFIFSDDFEKYNKNVFF